MSESPIVFVVDDQAGEIRSLIRRIKSRGYEIELATNELDARAGIEGIAEAPERYAGAIVDIMVATISLEKLLEQDDDVDLIEDVVKPSTDTGIRLCRYVREDLGLRELPLAALSVRDDDELVRALDQVGVTLYARGVEDSSEGSIMRFVEHYLPERSERA